KRAEAGAAAQRLAEINGEQSTIAGRLEDITNQLNDFDNALKQWHQYRGTLTAHVAQLRKQQTDIVKRTAEAAALRRRCEYLTMLMKAFGKDGVQRLLIDEALA